MTTLYKKALLAEANSKIESLMWLKTLLIEQQDSLRKEIDTLKTQHRAEIISALAKSAYFKTEDDRKSSVLSFTRANLTLEEINDLLEPLRDFKYRNVQAAEAEAEVRTKLPQKSTPDHIR